MPEEYIKWIQLIINAFALGAAGWIYRAYILNLKATVTAKDEQIKVVEKNLNFFKDKVEDLEKKTPEFLENALNQRIKIREDEIKRLSNDTESHKKELKIQNQELQNLKSELVKTKDVRASLSFIGEDFDDYFFARQGDLEIEEMGLVAVDSGQLMITDPCYVDSEWQIEEFEDLRVYKDKESGNIYQFRKDFSKYDEKIDGFELTVNELIESKRFEEIKFTREKNYSYAGACAATLSEEGWGEMKFNKGHEGAGVAFRTAFGEGLYPVYAEKYDGKIIRAYVNLI
ncbi:hypothetical protein [Owenweeksia hongkongensis]|uniref:hypothetical protein n=1 Tax=Owenweeksia hongkongensis TaxID=253245 RepID=UPI003A905E89